MTVAGLKQVDGNSALFPRNFLCSRGCQFSSEWLPSNVLCHYQKDMPDRPCSLQCLPHLFECCFFLAAGKASCYCQFFPWDLSSGAELLIKAVMVSFWILARAVSLGLGSRDWLSIIWKLIAVPNKCM